MIKKYKWVERFKCPRCDIPIRNPLTGLMMIPKYFIGCDPCGWRCECGEVISTHDMMRVETDD
jgi:hypothetical protein